MKIDHDKARALIDEAIRAGRLQHARHELRVATSEKLPRPEILPFAILARRAGLASLSVRLLNPLVRPMRKTPVVATGAEKAEYAASLTAIGAAEEALALLATLDGTKHPAVLLYRAFALVTQWDYAATVPLLRDYAASSQITSYERLVARVNLAAAYVAEGMTTEAESLLGELLAETRQGNYMRLYGAAVELSARNALTVKQWAQATRFIAEVERIFEGTGEMQVFLAKKWRCYLTLFRDGWGDPAAEQIAELRAEAIKISHWETLRDCDRYEAISRHDRDLLARVYFGTAHEAYRRRVLADFGAEAALPAEYEWHLGEKPGGPLLDLFQGSWDGKPGRLKTGKVVHRLFVALASDFYRPLRLAVVHYRLYPREFFNPYSSPGRVHRAISLFREWTSAMEAPFRIDERSGFYRLATAGSARVRLSHGECLADGTAISLQRIRDQIGAREFRSREVVGLLGSSTSAVQRLLKEAEDNGKVHRIGRGRSTRFRFAA